MSTVSMITELKARVASPSSSWLCTASSSSSMVASPVSRMRSTSPGRVTVAVWTTLRTGRMIEMATAAPTRAVITKATTTVANSSRDRLDTSWEALVSALAESSEASSTTRSMAARWVS